MNEIGKQVKVMNEKSKSVSKVYKIKSLIIVSAFLAIAAGIYLSWYKVEVFAPVNPEYGNKYDFKLSYSESKKYIELFNNEKFYDTSFPVTGEINIGDGVNFRIDMRVGFKKKTIYFHHIVNVIYYYAEDGLTKQYYYFDWFSDFFKYHLEVDRKHNGYIQQEGKEEWWKLTDQDPYSLYWYNSWCGWFDKWAEIYANGFMPLNQVVESLEISYGQQGYLSPFEGYEYGDEMLWDIYLNINPETDVFTYNGLEIMYVNGNCALNSNFIVRPIDYIRKPIK
jgi:hypothetical protein